MNIKFDFFYQKLEKGFIRTSVFIIDKTENKVIYTGWSDCNPRDNFCKSTGRRIAIKRALADEFNYARKQMIWKKYFEKCKTKHGWLHQ